VETLTEVLVAHEEIVALGPDIRDRLLYTAQSYQTRENEIQDLIEEVRLQTRTALSPKLVQESIARKEKKSGYPLSEDEKDAIGHLTARSAICVVLGRAGTGKTTMLEPVADAYRRAGYRVLGTSALGKVIDMMAREIGILCYTLDHLHIAWTQYKRLKEKLQEAGTHQATSRYIQRRLTAFQEKQLSARDVLISILRP